MKNSDTRDTSDEIKICSRGDVSKELEVSKYTREMSNTIINQKDENIGAPGSCANGLASTPLLSLYGKSLPTMPRYAVLCCAALCYGLPCHP